VDPWTGTRVITAIHARQDVYFGPLVERAPDFVLELALDGGASYNVMPSGGAGPTFTRVPEHEWLGKKGRSLQGAHRAQGLYLAAGPRVRACGEVVAGIADASATMLARMGVAPPDTLSGRVLSEILGEEGARTPLADAEVTPAATPDLARTEERLRAMGYIE
jgi:hypothetical protein